MVFAATFRQKARHEGREEAVTKGIPFDEPYS